MQNAEDILLSLLSAAEKRDYSGYSKFDALNSPLLRRASLNNKWLRLLYTQVVKEFPLNIRPLFGVKPSRNPKGIALFARAYFFLFQKTQDRGYLKRGELLLQWLLRNPSPGQDNLCWGYNFPWQSPIFFVDMFEPNAVVTAFVGEALIHAYRITGNETYLTAARSVAEFMVKDLPVLYDSEKERAVAYVLRRVGAVVLNNQVLTGAFLIKIWKHTGERDLRDVAIRQIKFTVGNRTPYDAWYYTYPAERSMIHHDNYHTGGILDGLLEYYEETGDDRYLDIYWKGLSYYERNLFEEDGAPRWMNDKKYPYDVHGSAQGIITFKKAARHKKTYEWQAVKVADWAIRNLYRQKTQDFSYRKGRLIKWNYSLMRWCNAWMARALAELTYEEEKSEDL